MAPALQRSGIPLPLPLHEAQNTLSGALLLGQDHPRPSLHLRFPLWRPRGQAARGGWDWLAGKHLSHLQGQPSPPSCLLAGPVLASPAVSQRCLRSLKNMAACSIPVSNGYFKEENWGWGGGWRAGGSHPLPPLLGDVAFRLQPWSSLPFPARPEGSPTRQGFSQGQWGAIEGRSTDVGTGVKKVLWGKLGRLPGGGEAEGQEPKEGMRSVLGHGDGGGQTIPRA